MFKLKKAKRKKNPASDSNDPAYKKGINVNIRVLTRDSLMEKKIMSRRQGSRTRKAATKDMEFRN